MAGPAVNRCILFGEIASQPKYQEDPNSRKPTLSFWISFPGLGNKTCLSPCRVVGDYANSMRELAPGQKVVVEGKLKTSELNGFLKVIEVCDASW